MSIEPYEGKPILFHSDGKIDDALEMLLEMGVDCLNPMDPSGVDYRDYKRRYGHRVTLSGNIDSTWPLVKGTPEDVERDVKEHMDVLKPGGPFFTHWIDALQCEGINDIPMGEFWKRVTEPDGPVTWHPDGNPSVKQAACAAHVYGKPVCQAEAFTYMGAGDWTSIPWNMKDIGDEAFLLGPVTVTAGGRVE